MPRGRLLVITLELYRPHWIQGAEDDPEDQCAHGQIAFVVNGVEFVTPSDGDWTVSAAGLFLLRAVTFDHTAESGVAWGNVLISCCGFTVYPDDGGRFPCVITGCPSGVDIAVRHVDDQVCLRLREQEETIRLPEWARATLSFSDQVQRFYDSCARKSEVDDAFERAGWKLFWQEWEARRDVARTIAGT